MTTLHCTVSNKLPTFLKHKFPYQNIKNVAKTQVSLNSTMNAITDYNALHRMASLPEPCILPWVVINKQSQT